MIYLASPYSHDDAMVRKDRARTAARVAAKLWHQIGEPVYSPIAHGVALEPHMLPCDIEDHSRWMDHCYQMFAPCSRVFVLCIDGWRESKGLAIELDWAKRIPKPVKYIWPTDDGLPLEFREVAPE